MDTSEMAATAQEFGERAKDALTEWQDKAKMTARNAGYSADRYVHEYAWSSIAFAVLAGCLLGFLLGKTRD